MAGLLFRIGRFAARRAWLVILSWVVVLAAAGGAFLAGSGPTSDQIEIPNTPTTEVQDRLRSIMDDEERDAELAEADAASTVRTIVVTTDAPGGFTSGQRADVERVVQQLSELPLVQAVSDPWAAVDELSEQRERFEAAEGQLEAGEQQLRAAQEGLAQAEAQAASSGATGDVRSELAAQRQGLHDQARTLAEQRSALDRTGKLLDWSGSASNVSQDERTALIPVTIGKQANEITAHDGERIRAAVDEVGLAGLDVFYSSGIAPEPAEGVSSEVIGLVVAAVVLIVMLGTLIGAGLPLLNALVGVAISFLLVMSTASIFDLNATTPVLAMMLGLAVGIDYTLFIVHRHRKQLLAGMDVPESVALANGTSGSAVVFAGVTVIIALLALNVTGIQFLGLMGSAGAVAIALAVLVAVTLTPALLGLVGTKILPKRQRAGRGNAGQEARPVRPMSAGRAWLTAIGAVLVLGVVSIPATQMRLGLPEEGGSAPASSTEHQAWAATRDAFGPGHEAPLIVVADVAEDLSETEADLADAQVAVGEALERTPDVDGIVPVLTSMEHSVVVFQVFPVGGPTDETTVELVHEIREKTLHDGDTTFSVAGATSADIDISEYLAKALTPYLVIVVGLSILVLVAVFRSLLVPLIATGGFVLSLFAALGATTAVFQFGWLTEVFHVTNPGPVLSFLPILAIGILFGLAMDYMLFIGAGIREAHVRGAEPREAVRIGVRGGRTVVIAAAIIMASVFCGFVFADNSIIAAIGMALTVGVLADAFLVRLLLIPALLSLLGSSAWWIPRWLDRILPDIDVEGSKLEDGHVAHH
uniref:MMPL family transporter n=1 Tax=Neobacillus citreus TaxID=2833578 RepID=A0A942SY72_9BACI